MSKIYDDFPDGLGRPTLKQIIKNKIPSFEKNGYLNEHNARPLTAAQRTAICISGAVLLLLLIIAVIVIILLVKTDYTPLSRMTGTGGEWKSPMSVVESENQLSDNDTRTELAEIGGVDILKYSPTYDKDIYNLLVIVAGNRRGGCTPDDILLISMDNRNKQLKLTTFLTATYVAVEKKGANRLSTVYSYGGAKLLSETIEYNFNVRIDSVAILNSNGFRKLVDKMGGIPTYLNTQNAQSVNAEEFTSAGTYTLNGTNLLAYMHIWQCSDNFDLTTTENDTTGKIFAKMHNYTSADFLRIFFDILSYVETDTNDFKLTSLLFNADKVTGYTVKRFVIPAENTYADTKLNNARILITDIKENSQKLNSFIYSY